MKTALESIANRADSMEERISKLKDMIQVEEKKELRSKKIKKKEF